MLRIGQMVVCVDTAPRSYSARPSVLRFLTKGQVYTVRGLYRDPAMPQLLCVNLDEVALPICEEWDIEYGYDASRFRPVRETNIDVFRKLVAPTPEKETA